MNNTLMTHMVCGYPNLGESQSIFEALSEKSKYIEVQFPFSDPIADGPVLELANKIALKNGITTEKCFDFVSQNIEKDLSATKVLIMTYYNIVLNYWVEAFIKKAADSWVYGLIIPDIPFDEADGKHIRLLSKQYGIVFTEVISPKTPDKRLAQIAKWKPELIYAISQNMTTGSKAQFGHDFVKYIENLKTYFNCPIWVWFWVKTKQDVANVCQQADFAIIGSEFVKQYDSWWIKAVRGFLKEVI